MSTVLGYIRVSREDQADSHLSLDAQKEQIQAYCTFRNLQLVDILCDEAISGGKPIQSRPAGEDLFARLNRGEAEAVVATKLDRMFRNALDCLQVNEVFQSAGVHLHLLDLNVDTSTAMGKAFLTIAAAFAELELNRGKERTRDALKALKERGVNLGAVPFGFSQVLTDDGLRTFKEDTSEQKVLDAMVELRRLGMTYEQIATELNQCGVNTKTGKSKWRRGSVHKILKRNEVLSNVEAN